MHGKGFLSTKTVGQFSSQTIRINPEAHSFLSGSDESTISGINGAIIFPTELTKLVVHFSEIRPAT